MYEKVVACSSDVDALSIRFRQIRKALLKQTCLKLQHKFSGCNKIAYTHGNILAFNLIGCC